MRFIRLIAGVAGLVIGAAPALAGEVPLMRPAPDWIDKAPLDARHLPADAPELLVLDTQARITNGELWSYTDRAVRAGSPEALGPLATLMVPWAPDKGDLIIHEAAILRDGQAIDLLAGGKGFTVLRREASLEARDLTGILTATLPVEGLQVGDILRLRYSITLKDAALAGNADVVLPLPASPLRINFGRSRVEWQASTPAHWHLIGKQLIGKPVRAGSYAGIEVDLPVPKQPDRPGDAPLRYQAPPLFEASTFASWQDVSRVFAPLYATDGLIPPGSPLASVLAEVKAAPTPMGRVQVALRHVQDDVRYLALLMGNGNYVPQKPAETWTKRYGDCKAKALLLLALLRGAGIEGEPVLASIPFGDMLPDRIPSAAAFNHVIVRATVDGQVLWLDGTASGTRLEDLADTPNFHHVLPLRPQGSGLIDLPMRPMARPLVSMTIDADESTSVDLPSAVTAKIMLRGPLATKFFAVSDQLDSKQRNKLLIPFLDQVLAPGQWVDISLVTDAATGTATVGARGITATPWRWQDKRMQRKLDLMLQGFKFEPDRSRNDWADIPVAVSGPMSTQVRLTLHLPDHGAGFSVEGTPDASVHFAGHEMTRHMTIDNGILTMDEQLHSLGGEIPAAAIPQERDLFETARAALPKLKAPATVTRAWMVSPTAATQPGQLAKIDAVLDLAARQHEADNASPFTERALVRRQIGDFAGAVVDYTQALAINPNAETYLAQARVLASLGRMKEALVDTQKARAIDPSSRAANELTADLLAKSGDLAAAVELLDQRIAVGGDSRDAYRLEKASLLGQFGDPQTALALLDAQIADKPGNPALLNARCWVKGSRNVMLDTALKDCTDALELSSSGYAVLDSRAMVWFRLGRYKEALQDLDAVLAQIPAFAPSRFLRAVVELRLGDRPAAAADLALARRLYPWIEHDYARYGITP